MEYNLAIPASLLHGFGVGKISLQHLHSELLKLRIASPRKASNSVSFLQQKLDYGTTQETAAASDQCFHEIFSVAHRASFSRKILALWRTSTGKEG